MLGTSLISTTRNHIVEHYARQLPLAILKPPIDFPVRRFYQLWYGRTQQSQSHAWLRLLLSTGASTADAKQGLRQPSVSSRNSSAIE